jgi:hypothetical protein
MESVVKFEGGSKYDVLEKAITEEFDKYNVDRDQNKKPLMYSTYSPYEESTYKNLQIDDKIKEIEKIVHSMCLDAPNVSYRDNRGETMEFTSPEGFHNAMLQNVENQFQPTDTHGHRPTKHKHKNKHNK